MSDAMNRLRNKLLGTVGVDDAPQVESKPNPMLIGIMKSFGLSPEMIAEYANSVKAAVLGKLSSIDDSLTAINAKLDTLEMRLVELESNQRVILDSLNDPNEEQFAQMAEHPLDTVLTITEQ